MKHRSDRKKPIKLPQISPESNRIHIVHMTFPALLLRTMGCLRQFFQHPLCGYPSGALRSDVHAASLMHFNATQNLVHYLFTWGRNAGAHSFSGTGSQESVPGFFGTPQQNHASNHSQQGSAVNKLQGAIPLSGFL